MAWDGGPTRRVVRLSELYLGLYETANDLTRQRHIDQQHRNLDEQGSVYPFRGGALQHADTLQFRYPSTDDPLAMGD